MIDLNTNKESNTTPQEKKLNLFLQQKETLDLFLERGAISQAQYNKSLGDLKEKMGIGKLIEADKE